MSGEMGDDLLLANALTLFTFAFLYFGWKISGAYFILGISFMVASIWYWGKVKKESEEEL